MRLDPKEVGILWMMNLVILVLAFMSVGMISRLVRAEAILVLKRRPVSADWLERALKIIVHWMMILAIMKWNCPLTNWLIVGRILLLAAGSFGLALIPVTVVMTNLL